MKHMRDFGFAGWAASMSVLFPGLPRQCTHDWPDPPGGGGSAGSAGANVSGGAAGATTPGGASGSCAGSDCSGAGGSTGTAGSAATGANGGVAGQSCNGSNAPVCGNGCVESGEECDDGAGNAPTGECDVDCTWACQGACPLRVDPAAATNGSGRDWAHPINHIQTAIDLQSARGGGAIWIIAGNFSLPDVDGQNGISIPANVTLVGGFVGDMNGGVTKLRGVHDAALLSIESATNVIVRNLQLADGDPVFRIQSSRGVAFEGVVVEPDAEYTNNPLSVNLSEVRFEGCTLSLPQTGQGLYITDSDAILVNSTVTSLEVSTLSPKLWAHSGRLLMDRSNIERGVIVEEGAEALVLESSLPNTYAPGAALYVAGRAAAIGTEFGMGYGYASVDVSGSAMIFNSSFTGYATATRGGYPTAWAIAGSGALTVSLSSFLGGACMYSRDTPCPAIQAGAVDNSFFLYDEDFGPAYVGENYDPETLVTLDGVLQPSNCTVAASRGSGAYPCADAGDEVRLNASHHRLLEYVATFRRAPFHVNLGRYLNLDFWKSETVVSSSCGDVNAPDPGRHRPCAP